MTLSVKRPALFAICAIALIHAALYIVYQASDRQAMVNWSDQRGYQRLGESLAVTGQFTRYAGTETFTPEVIRTPGYPAFVAVIYKVFGVGNNTAVAVAQAVVFAAICLLVFALVKRAWNPRAAVLAAMLTSLYSPMPYFGALVVTELWTAFVLTAAMVILVRATQVGALRDFALAGMLLSATTIVRPAFVLMPFFFAMAVPVLVRTQRTVPRLKGWGVLTLTAGLTLLPWFTYNYVNLGRFTLSPAGGIGRGLWEGSWQGQWPGRIQAELTHLAETTADRQELNRRVEATATETGLPAGPMLQYVGEWRDVRLIWDTPTDPMERVRARVAADSEYLRYALIRMRGDPVGHVRRHVVRGLFILWAAEIPIRYGDINAMPTLVIRGIWLVQVVLLLVAAWGAIVLARSGRWLEAVVLTLPIIYVTGVHLPLLCEARQSLPVKPVVLALAAIGLSRRTRAVTSPGTAGS